MNEGMTVPRRAKFESRMKASVDRITTPVLMKRPHLIAVGADPRHGKISSKRMNKPTDSLILDLVEWVARMPRPYEEVIAALRTSCPRLTIWEDAIDDGFVTRASGAMIMATEEGKALLRKHGRLT